MYLTVTFKGLKHYISRDVVATDDPNVAFKVVKNLKYSKIAPQSARNCEGFCLKKLFGLIEGFLGCGCRFPCWCHAPKGRNGEVTKHIFSSFKQIFRKDLLALNVKIFKVQGQALDQFAKKTCKILVS